MALTQAAVVSKHKQGAYFKIIKKVLFNKSDCKGSGLYQYVIKTLSTVTSKVTHKNPDKKSIGVPYPYMNIMKMVWSS